MKELPVDILRNEISKFIEKQIMKPKSDTNFYICAFENVQAHITSRTNEIEVVDSIEK